MEIFSLVIGIVIFTGLSAFFSASETSLFSLPSIRLKTYEKNSDPRKRLIASLLSKPRDLLVSILMMNILVNILVQNLSSNLFENSPGWLFKVGIPLLLTLLFGEIIPKSIALSNNTSLSYRISPVIASLQHVLGSVRSIIATITTYVCKILFFFLKKEKSISKEELRHVLKTSKKYGVLHANESKLINGYLNLQEATVKEVMHPREDVIFYKTSDPLSELIHLFSEQECSRLPVSDKELDSIHGIITAKQFFLNQENIHAPEDLNDFLYKPFFTPETSSARALLKQLKEKGEEMAIAVDEYGSVTGLVTDEDLVEVVIGPITDRRDESPRYTKASHDIIIASGKFELSEFKIFFGDDLPSNQNMVTIGGWLTEQLGDIPKSGTKHLSHGYLFHVLSSDPNRIRRIYIRKLTSPPPNTKERIR